MPIHFIDNYPRNDLGTQICRADKSPLFGEIWLYQELAKFNDNEFLKEENWYVKHSYNLSSHPFSEGKVEGEIDFLILSKYGLLIIEVKGGGIEVDTDDIYYSYDKKNIKRRYEAQNPFVQVKEYVHSLKSMLDANPFIYRAVIFPHEANFKLKGPQLSGYNYLFFSKKELDEKDTDFAKNKLLFDFFTGLAKKSRKTIVEQLHNNIAKDKLETRIWQQFPQLDKRNIDRLRSELFPQQTTYGFDPDRIRDEIILEENYEILKGLRKNPMVMVEGGPGTGKTVLATKFLAENLIKQHRGIYFCANKLLRAKMEYMVCVEYKLDPNLIDFKVYNQNNLSSFCEKDVDFVIIDEAQEFFDKGLDIFVDNLRLKMDSPKIMVLYDPEQAIIQDFKDIDWYADFLLETSFVHYLFDKTWRCTQSQQVSLLTQLLKNGQYKKILKDYHSLFIHVSGLPDKLRSIKDLVTKAKQEIFKYIILVDSHLLNEFREIAKDYFLLEIEELKDHNINLRNQKLRFTSPIMFRGLEAEHVFLITTGINAQTKIQSYISVSRAIYTFQCLIWE